MMTEGSMTIYTIGYGKIAHPSELLELAESMNAIVADVRHSPASRNPRWRRGFLEKTLGQRYIHVPGLGNLNYKGGPVALADVQAGADQLAILIRAQPVILMCVCVDWRTCHRTDAAKALAERFGLTIENLAPPSATGRLL